MEPQMTQNVYLRLSILNTTYNIWSHKVACGTFEGALLIKITSYYFNVVCI